MPDGDKVRVTLELDKALVEKVGLLGKDLSFTVERALRRVVPTRRPPLSDAELATYIEQANQRFDRAGMAADDYIAP